MSPCKPWRATGLCTWSSLAPLHHLHAYPHGLNFHFYVDNTQIYLSTSPTTLLPPQSTVNCLLAIKTWMTTDLLKKKQKKNRTLHNGSIGPASEGGVFYPPCGWPISPSPEVHNLGHPGVYPHIKSFVRSGFFHLKKHFRTPAITLSLSC